MTLATYSGIQTGIGNWLHRAGESGLTDRIDEWIELAEDRFYAELRIRPMEATTDLTISSQEVSLPSSFLGVRRLYISGTPNKRLEYISPPAFWEKYLSTQTGLPKAFTIEGENLVFGPSPDDSYTGKILYWKRLTALSSSNTSNWFTTNARGLYLYGALLEAAAFFNHPSEYAQRWALLYDDIIEKIKVADKLDRFPSAIAMESTGITPA